ncbi:MAG: signal peptidase [Planctomycetes bacterium]|nr:signal peptidase [Planctomycetota bacterium]MCK5578167.1 signal peptidase [Planctomycetota bacterium]
MWSVIVRYGAMGLIGTFKTRISGLKIGDKCIMRTDRGTELGTTISASQEIPAGPGGGPRKSFPGEVLRKALAEDFKIEQKIETEKKSREFDFCEKKIKELKLTLNLVFVEHLFGGEKVVFYFVAEGRVDFRELVKELAKEYKTRIEMRQIGVRDEARLLADVEHCGRELCCKSFIKDLEPVTMKMAKSQKTTLDPAKISGRCGRLMCCLRYEDEVYTQLKKKLPNKGARVSTKDAIGDVVELDIFAQSVTIENDKRERIKIKVDEIIKVIRSSALEIKGGGDKSGGKK